MIRLSATSAARTFSEVLNRVASGEEIEITRNGATVAVITPPRVRFVSAARFRALLADRPAADDRFADDIRAAVRDLEHATEVDPWRRRPS
jgi:prevent-host-death family protein